MKTTVLALTICSRFLRSVESDNNNNNKKGINKMCLLIFAKGGATPSKKSLRIAARNNPDGFGFAIIGDGMIHRFRSMDIEETITAFFEARKRFPKGHAIFHLRITTHGATNVDNCHPFVINDAVVMGHNGILPIKEEDGRSDTRIFAEDWMPELGIKNLLDDADGVKELEKFIGYSKLAFLNVGDELDKPFYIINERLGHWSDGVWYSNSSYEESLYLPRGYTSSRTWESSWLPPHYDDDETGAGVMEPDYRNYDYSGRSSNADMAFCNDRLEWLPAHEVEDYDLVEWVCGECGHREMFDLLERDPILCRECETCYYCSLNKDWCTCSDLSDEILFGDVR